MLKIEKKQPVLLKNIEDISEMNISETLKNVEKSVLGAILLENEAIHDVVDFLQPPMFSQKKHQDIYGVLQNLYDQKKSIDLYTVAMQLKKNGKLKNIGGPIYLSHLTNNIASSAHIENHAHIIVENFMRRKLILTSQKTFSDANLAENDLFDLLDRHNFEIEKIENCVMKNESSDEISEILGESFKNLADKKNLEKHVITNFSKLDNLFDGVGFRKNELTVIAGRPGSGKTTFMLNVALNTVKNDDRPVLFFSLEMSKKIIAQKIISCESAISFTKIAKKQLTNNELKKAITTTTTVANSSLKIDDRMAINCRDIFQKARIVKRKHGLKAIFVDYLQIIKPFENGKFTIREQQISAIARSLKKIAKELDIAVIVGCQLNRNSVARGGSTSQLSDLRESDSIGQESDNVLFLKSEEDEPERPVGYTILEVLKHRNGATGKFAFIFDKPKIKFEETFLL